MILYGSQTSPFVRRLRLLLPETAYEFRKVDIFNPQERRELLKLSPLLKIPILKIGEQTIWDSRVIFNELIKKGIHRTLSLHEENVLTALNDLSDSLVQKLLISRSKLELPEGTPIEISHRERIENTLNFLSEEVTKGTFSEWNFLSMGLYTLIDWVEFRDLVNLAPYSKLTQFKKDHAHEERIALTNPRT